MYIKQVALIAIMAQIGCYVPAKHATIPVRDRILSRIGTSDDMEHNLSSFQTEMKESAYILNNLTKKSLVLVDELGRGTSNVDGEMERINHVFSNSNVMAKHRSLHCVCLC